MATLLRKSISFCSFFLLKPKINFEFYSWVTDTAKCYTVFGLQHTMQKVHQTLNWHSLLVAQTKVNYFITESSQLLQHYIWLQHALTQFAFSYSDTIYLSFKEDYLIHHPTFSFTNTSGKARPLSWSVCCCSISAFFTHNPLLRDKRMLHFFFVLISKTIVSLSSCIISSFYIPRRQL